MSWGSGQLSICEITECALWVCLFTSRITVSLNSNMMTILDWDVSISLRILLLAENKSNEAGYRTPQEIKIFQGNMITRRWRINIFVQFCQNIVLNLFSLRALHEKSATTTQRESFWACTYWISHCTVCLSLYVADKAGDSLYFCYQQML